MSHKFVICLFALAVSLPVGCGKQSARRRESQSQQEVKIALSQYREAVLKQDSGAITALFEERAAISHGGQRPIVGREKIRKFLQSFAAYRVLSYDIEARSTDVEGDVATQDGNYRQTVVVPDGKTITVRGSIHARWKRHGGKWLIESMHTASL
jgi:uncharacterized protein (TIGR02246 family)